MILIKLNLIADIWNFQNYRVKWRTNTNFFFFKDRANNPNYNKFYSTHLLVRALSKTPLCQHKQTP